MEVSVAVRMTEDDIIAGASDRFDEKLLPAENGRKIVRLIIFMIFAIYALLTILFDAAISYFRGNILWNRLGVAAICVILICASVLINEQIPKIVKKNTVKLSVDNFRKDPNAQILRTFIFSKDGISIHSSIENSMLQWNDIYHITEYASFFAVEISSQKFIAIPRRCFTNEQQLRDMRSYAASGMPASILLRGFPLGISRPDEGTGESVIETAPTPDRDDCLYSITYQLTEKEGLNLGMSVFLHGKAFKQMAVLFGFLFGMAILTSLDHSRLLWTYILGGVAFSFVFFFLFFSVILKEIRTDKTFCLEETVSFFSDRLVTQSNCTHVESLWNTVIRIKFVRAGLLIYCHPGSALVIPTRCYNDWANKAEFITFITSRETARSKRK